MVSIVRVRLSCLLEKRLYYGYHRFYVRGRWTVLSRAGEALVVVELLAIFRDVSGQKDKDGRQLPAEKALFARSPVSQSTRPTLRQRAQNGWKQVV